MVRAMKNRFGPVDEVGCFDLVRRGHRRRSPTRPGCSSSTTTRTGPRHLRGRDDGGSATPAERGAGPGRRRRRASDPAVRPSGSTSSRVAMVLAVLQQHAGIRLHSHDVFVVHRRRCPAAPSRPTTWRSRWRSPRPRRARAARGRGDRRARPGRRAPPGPRPAAAARRGGPPGLHGRRSCPPKRPATAAAAGSSTACAWSSRRHPAAACSTGRHRRPPRLCRLPRCSRVGSASGNRDAAIGRLPYTSARPA